jgi:glycosyltransferase involved in cell wall biosynthesis
MMTVTQLTKAGLCPGREENTETPRDILLWLKTVAESGNLKERLAYQNASLWWFFEPGLTNLLTNLVSNKAYRPPTSPLISAAKRLPRYYYLYLLARSLPRYIWGRLTTTRPGPDGARGRVLAVSYAAYWKRVPLTQSQDNAPDQDTMLGGITTALRREGFKVTGLEYDTSLLFDLRTAFEKRGLWRPAETYLTPGAVKQALRANKRYQREWANLEKSRDLANSVNYKGEPLWGPIKGALRGIFEYRTFEAALFIELMRRAIERERPDLILITYEYGLAGMAAVIAGKLAGVPTLAVQHGNISPGHIGYLHTRAEISGESAPKYYPLPDKTAVYGPWVKRVLVEDGNYPEDRVAVTGQARYDFLAGADRTFSREDFCKRLKIGDDSKIALICTQPLPILKEREAFVEGVLGALKGFPGLQIVIKPHPLEKRRWLEEAAAKQGARAVILPPRSNTYEALYAGDVMLASFSTTITEAIILDKPAVVVNLSGRPDFIPYAESGAALGAYQARDIAPAVRKALYDQAARQSLRRARARFVREHCYQVDGRAGDRVVSLIKQMIKEAKEGEK